MYWSGEKLVEGVTHVYIPDEAIKDCINITKSKFLKKYKLDERVYNACRKYVVEKKLNGAVL